MEGNKSPRPDPIVRPSAPLINELGLPAAEIVVRLKRLGELEREVAERDAELQWTNERLIAEMYDRQAAEDSAATLRNFDPVTGLPNRAWFERRVDDITQSCIARSDSAAVIVVGIGRMTAVRTAMGYAAADLVAKQVAERLRLVVRGIDLLARVGDHDFGALLVQLRSPHDAAALARKMVETVEAPLRIDGREVRVGAAIGVAVAPDDGSTGDMLLARAGAAMQYAREHGMRLYQFFNPAIGERSVRRVRLEAELRQAVEQRQFGVFYQPRVDIKTRRIVSIEALVRWYHPERGMLAPAEFLDIAEETGLIVPIGAQVLRQACIDASMWPGKVHLGINLSPREFRGESLRRSVAEALQDSGLPASRLEIDITEASLGRRLGEIASALATISELRGLGVRVALDDFGTGACSLSLLHRCRVDMLKIDGSFIRGMEHDAAAVAVVRSIAALGRHFQVRVMAEGVENELQLELARKAGCIEAQGYLFGQPQPAALIAQQLARIAVRPPRRKPRRDAV